MHVVPRATAQLGIIVHPVPGFATIVGAKESTVGGFDQRPDAIWFRRGDRNPDFAEESFRQPGVTRDLIPGVATVARSIQSAFRATAVQRPGVALDLPDRGIEEA